MKKVKDLVYALDQLTGGRVITERNPKESHPFVIWKNSGIQGKEVLETPGLVYGNPEKKLRKIAVAMTISEQDIELAAATGVDAIVAHHPIADGASSGGVTLRNYLDLYDIAVLELHEAFHGLHPGIPFLHGHRAHYSSIDYGGKEGNVLFAGKTLPEIKVLGDILNRLHSFMGLDEDRDLIEAERRIRKASADLTETSIVTNGRIVIGAVDSVVENILHIFPHTGFTVDDLRSAKLQFPEADTLLASISRVRRDSELILEARKLGLQFIIGNCHALEIYENGLPLAYALEALLPDVEVMIFRERVTSQPVRDIGNARLKEYGQSMAEKYLVHKVKV
jgi:hypothetical protein